MNPKQDTTLPNDTISIVFDILQKHLSEENNEEFFGRFEKQRTIREEIVVRLMEKLGGEKANLKELTLGIKKELNVSMKKATDVARDIEKQIKTSSTSIEKKSLKTTDTYRETIE